MTAAIIALAVCVVVLLIALLWVLRAFDEDRSAAEKHWREERAELLNRIQHPEIIPPRDVQMTPWQPPEDAGAMAEIGTADLYRDDE